MRGVTVQYFVLFLEGVITFISPCLLPMLPVYVSYFAGGQGERGSAVANALGFVAGFTVVFTAMGAFAGTIGALLRQHQTAVNIVTGAVVVLLGLNFLGVLPFALPGSAASGRLGGRISGRTGPMFSVLFGIAFSISWTPCVSAFLGSALMMASSRGSALHGVLLLLCFSAGLGIPFLASAVLIDRLKSTFGLIKRNYRVISAVSGIFLVAVGAAMMTGLFGRIMPRLLNII
jgi:cytochrome c-type biogenesis protein